MHIHVQYVLVTTMYMYMNRTNQIFNLIATKVKSLQQTQLSNGPEVCGRNNKFTKQSLYIYMYVHDL